MRADSPESSEQVTSDPTHRPFSSLVASELLRSRGRKTPLPDSGEASWLIATEEDIVGLALSGGGIRSATFNLGLLQGLDRLGFLPAIDYMSTVSGGGYIGGFWSAHRFHDPNGEFFPRKPAKGKSEPDPVRHLREFSNFLSPRLGLLSADTGRLVVAALAAMLPSLAATLSLIVLALVAWATAGFGVLSANTMVSRGTLALITLVPLVLMERRLRSRERWRTSSGPAGDTAPSSKEPTALRWTRTLAYPAAVVLVTVAIIVAYERFLSGGIAAPLTFADVTGLLADNRRASLELALVWLTPVAPILALRAITSPMVRSFPAVTVRAAFDRTVARLLLFSGVWLVFVLAVWTGEYLVDTKTALAAVGIGTPVAAVVVAWLQKRVAEALRGEGVGGKVLERLRPKLPAILSWVVVFGMAALVAAAMRAADVEDAVLGMSGSTAIIVASAIVTFGTLLSFDPNRIGLHAFYRGRIARTFLGASNPRTKGDRNRGTEEAEGDDIFLNRLPGRPLHLVGLTANELAPIDPLESLHRGARSAVLSPVGFSVGDAWRLWEGENKDADAPTLGAALTASGAAFNPMMGSYSVRLGRGVTFLMAAFNLRLGRWVRHPHGRGESKNFWFPGRLFYKELFGRSRTDKGHVHLSDGGHFENMALYELIRRHCRYVIVSDCGADADVAFNDLATLMRRVREDFGVEIRVDLGALRPDKEGRSRQPVVVGEIEYPGGDRGTMLIFKPCLVGSEPEDIVQYRRRHKIFPHEPTVDQFYDAAQWESYKRLGQHAVETAFAFAHNVGTWWRAPIDVSDSSKLRQSVAQLFAEARFRWLTASPALSDKIAEVSASLSKIEESLTKPDLRFLAAQVYPDVRAALALSGRNGSDGDRIPTAEEFAAALPVLRQALRCFEDGHRKLGLEGDYTHPAHLGIINAMGRWTGTPLFRLLWPVLRALHNPSFVGFLEARFRLDVKMLGPARAVEFDPKKVPDSQEFAVAAWRNALPAGTKVTREGDCFAAYVITVGYGDRKATVQVGFLRYRKQNLPSDPHVVLWAADDLFIPPGLWGTGLGGGFLRDLISSADSPIYGQHVLVTDIREGTGFDMYRQEGFRRTGDMATFIVGDSDGTLVIGIVNGRPLIVRAVDAQVALGLRHQPGAESVEPTG